MKASNKIGLAGQNRKMKGLLELYMDNFGDTDISVFRVPARINLLGTHIEHRGGHVNCLTIDKELLCVSGKRTDRKVSFCNIDRQYRQGEFTIDEELPQKGVEWLDFIRKANITHGEWGNYIKAAVLYLQNRFFEKSLSGMNLAFHGEIPVGSGLSSSSAVVVAAVSAFCRVNNLEIKKEVLSMMCGEAEWYVGTRGGCGDHAAMLFGRKNEIANMRFFPFNCEFFPFPEEYRIISCDSLIEAKKSANARSLFNERIAAYEIGLRLIKKKFPAMAEKLAYLRDISPANIGSEKLVYEILLSLPETMTRREVVEALPEENLDFLFESHSVPPEGYRLRDIILYGVSECERARICSEFLKSRDMAKFGELMFISHEGDRISFHLPGGKKRSRALNAGDSYMKELIKLRGSSIPGEREKASLYKQPGAYRCSTEELDFIVDAVRGLKGVEGAKLTGAGLGGTVLVLVRAEEAENVISVLNEKYYRPRGLPESAFICQSVNGVEEI